MFDVDDGPKTRQDTRELLTESYRQGVRTIVSTSHRRKGMFETPEEKIYQNYLAALASSSQSYLVKSINS